MTIDSNAEENSQNDYPDTPPDNRSSSHMSDDDYSGSDRTPSSNDIDEEKEPQTRADDLREKLLEEVPARKCKVASRVLFPNFFIDRRDRRKVTQGTFLMRMLMR